MKGNFFSSTTDNITKCDEYFNLLAIPLSYSFFIPKEVFFFFQKKGKHVL
jgi:hypothetical protein